jgi:glycosyltransferase involved in cell wall biosynthesis
MITLLHRLLGDKSSSLRGYHPRNIKSRESLFMPTVSVLMNCYNGEKYLREAIDSVYAQTYTDWEIILWDDASTDRTEEIARSYDAKLRYFKGEKSISLGQARNYALGKASGEFIAFLDQDDLWMPQKLEMQIPLFKTDEKIGIVISDSYIFNDTEEIVKQIHRRKKPPTGYVFKELLKNYFISLETTIIRRVALESLNYWFDERFTMIEEVDLFTRIAYEWKFGYIDKPLGKWRMHKDSWTFSQPLSLPNETKMMLETYIQIFDRFEDNYKNEIEFLKAKIDMNLSKLDIIEGRSRDARRKLCPYMHLGYKYIFLYLLSFFPAGVFERLRQWRGNRPS